MVYGIIGSGFDKTAIVNGSDGQYGQFDDSTKLKNHSIFGKNAASNFNDYTMQELGRRPIDPYNPAAIEYEAQYSPVADPTSKEFKMALMGNAQEDLASSGLALDKNGAASLADLNKMAQQAYGDNSSYNAYDINKDGKISSDENAAAIMLKDGLDGQDMDNLKPLQYDGKFTNSGDANSAFMLNDERVDNNRGIAQDLYNKYHLGDAKKDYDSLMGNKTASESETQKKSEKTNNMTFTPSKDASTLSHWVAANKSELAKQYGTDKLYGDNGLVNIFENKLKEQGLDAKKLKTGQAIDFSGNSKSDLPAPVKSGERTGDNFPAADLFAPVKSGERTGDNFPESVKPEVSQQKEYIQNLENENSEAIKSQNWAKVVETSDKLKEFRATEEGSKLHDEAIEARRQSQIQ